MHGKGEGPTIRVAPEAGLKASVIEDADIERFLPQIAKAYVSAFAGDPWYEVSMCEDDKNPKGCASGFSPLAVGEVCPHCNKTLTEAAYKEDELQEHFKGAMQSKEHAWYVEEASTPSGKELALASFAWKVTTPELVASKYEGREDMQAFFDRIIPAGESYVWLDEVFADKAVRSAGNLKNFKAMIIGMAAKLGLSKVVYRTINEAMVHAPLRDFPNATTVYRTPAVPDRRTVVVIDLAHVEA